MEQHQQAYKEEATEILVELESSLLALEETPDDKDLVDQVFRSLHTIKGSGQMFGFDDIAEFTHEIETIFDQVRNGEMQVSKQLVTLALAARDQIWNMLQDGEPVEQTETERIVSALKMLTPENSSTQPDSAGQTDEQQTAGGELTTYWIRFKPAEEIFLTGADPMRLLQELGELGEARVVAQTESVPPFEDFNPEACYIYWDIILTTEKGEDAIHDMFIFVEDDADITVRAVDEGQSDEDHDYHKKLGEILLGHGDVRPEDLQKVLGKQKRVGELLTKAGIVDTGKVQAALVEQQQVKEARSKRKENQAASSIRVASDKLDMLVDLVGELVTAQSRLSQISEKSHDNELRSISEEVERLTSELRDNTMSIRMLPIGTTFGKFKRLVRDLSQELGKEVDLVTEGAETELDKTVIERLNDPLVHLIRNSMDHGIEAPEVREARGKPRTGTVRLEAVHSGASVLINISDDGAGLDTEAIRARAIERGLVSPDTELKDKDIYALIFAAGFSTARQLSNVSGRGVGMDVVKRAMEALRGSIDVTSAKGKGSTITLKLPLTLAIIEGLLVKIADSHYVLPLSAVEECIELSENDIERSNGRQVANVRDEIVPYINLRERFRIAGERPAIEQIVITDVDGQRIGFVVDEVMGEHQTVIKSLGKLYADIKEISGATILGDGTLALILDLAKLADSAELEEHEFVHGKAEHIHQHMEVEHA